VALVQTKAELEAQIYELTAYSKTFIGIMLLFGAGMALASIYTATDSVLWERTRELATLRTLGFGMGRLALFVTIENLLVAAAGAVLGVAAGRGVADYLIRTSQTEGFTLRAVTGPGTYLLAAGGALLLTLLGQWPGLERIRRLDLAAAIRVREE
jgi:putative ABC transport system permease protein